MVRNFDPEFIQTLAIQSWSLYGVGMALVVLRIYARIHRLGFKGLQTDDYLMLGAGCFYTLLIVCLNVISQGGGSNLYLPEDYPNGFTPEEVEERIQGSKIVVVSEQAMLNVIYIIKVCMLIMYTRLTLGLNAQRLVRYLAGYVAAGWVGTEIAFFTACRPFSGYWAMPPPNAQCTTLFNYAIVQGCFNITSDLLMLCIPLPLVTRLCAPWKQKAVLILIFSMGIFVIVAAILTKVFNLTNAWDPSYMLWYTRESSVAVYVSNIPMIWPLLREYFPWLKSLTPGQKTTTSQPGRTLGTCTGQSARTTRRLSGGILESRVTTTIRGMRKSDSTEELSGFEGDAELGIITREESWSKDSDRPIFALESSTGPGQWDKAGIQKVTTVHVSEEHVQDVESGSETHDSGGIRSTHDTEKPNKWGF